MGCSQSKIENEEAVSRCKERKQHMKDAVAARKAFAAAHSSYAVSLKNVGAALTDFASGESLIPHPHLSHSNSAPSGESLIPPFGTLPPPPPPIPADMAVQPPAPLHRAHSMPEFAVSKAAPNQSETIMEEEEEDDDDDEEEEEGEEVESEVHSLKRKEEGAERIRPPPTPPPPMATATNQEPPSPPPGNSPYDFFFSYDMPGGGLRVPEVLNGEREEFERKVLEERGKRNELDSSVFHVRKMDDQPSKTPDQKPPVSSPQEDEAAPVEKIARRGKQVIVGSGQGGGGEAKRAPKSTNLVQIFNDLDDFFLKASESANEVSKMLEAARLHYHSSTANNCGHINHSERVMKVITWNRSFRGLQNADDKDDFDSEENETHATVLDKLLAWEKKLYDEVKAGEIMKFEYQKKVALLNKQKKCGSSPETLEKTKASLSRLHTRYIVDMQSLDSTVSEINRLRDDQLYPKLKALVDGLGTMWSMMQSYHSKQSKIAGALKNVDISQCVKETREQHFEQTEQLWIIVQEWHNQFDRMVSNQKRYIKDLNSWLKLNLIPIESSVKEKVSSPPRAQNPNNIQRLLLAWQDCLEKLPEEHAKTAIYNFGGVLHNILQQQEEELKMRAKCEEAKKELARKTRSFEEWYCKHLERRGPQEEFVHDEALIEREATVEAAKRRLEEEEAAYQKQCVQVREKALANLRTRLPELFWSLLDFSGACSAMYNQQLKSVCHSSNRRERSS